MGSNSFAKITSSYGVNCICGFRQAWNDSIYIFLCCPLIIRIVTNADSPRLTKYKSITFVDKVLPRIDCCPLSCEIPFYFCTGSFFCLLDKYSSGKQILLSWRSYMMVCVTNFPYKSIACLHFKLVSDNEIPVCLHCPLLAWF